jgi:undecaprenyl diphosphate synthase
MINKPRHIAFIMDGNGRWAQSQGLPRSKGHKAGYEKIPSILEACIALDLNIVTVFVWSTENWGRPKTETNYIMTRLKKELPKFARELDSRGIRFQHIGRKEGIDAKILNVINEAEEMTRHHRKAVFNFLFNYGARAEIYNALQKIIVDKVIPTSITEEIISQYLWTAELPDVDILVRTGGEKRISNFMIWQCANAEIHFLDKYWPDINADDIKKILRQSQQPL